MRYQAELDVCGWHKSITGDPEHNFLEPVVSKCPVCAAEEKLRRVLAAEDEELRKSLPKVDGKPDPKADDPADGRRISMRLLTPAEVARRQQSTKG